MASDILGIGQSALFAAQTALATTSHNISNATTPGYNRQTVIQSSAGGINTGAGFIGQGTQVAAVSRVYDDFLTKQVLAAQTSASSLDSYASQISQIDDVVANTSAGLSPALQTFFKSLGDLSANPNTDASRQAVLSNSSTLIARFQSLAGQFNDSSTALNGQITSSVTTINSYASQIGQLNDAIVHAVAATGNQPNDLLDQRDQIVASMNKVLKTTTALQNNGAMDVFIGSGQSLVLGDQVTQMVAVPTADDQSRLQLGLNNYGTTIMLPDTSVSGGSLGGLLDYRSTTLDVVKNTLGRIATVMGTTINAQQVLGQDQNGVMGTNFFNVAAPVVVGKTGNSVGAALTATITDASKLTTSDYRMQFNGTNYTITRLSDGVQTSIPGPPTAYPSPAPTVDGVTFSAPTMVAGDSFIVKPTINGASGLGVALTNTSSIAAAAPITTAIATTNTGNTTISAGSVDKNYLSTPPTLPMTATYAALGGTITLTGAVAPITVNGSTVTSPFTYTSGATITSGGVSFVLSGTPADTDNFTISANTKGVADNRNVQLMSALQTANTIGNTSYQGSYSGMVSLVGNKANEVQVMGDAEKARVASITTTQQSESGVNQDEELANLIRYQNAYQAGAKIIQAGSDMFKVLFALGN